MDWGGLGVAVTASFVSGIELMMKVERMRTSAEGENTSHSVHFFDSLEGEKVFSDDT